ncbi:MAG TPA: serine protease [bacterium]|nr:serine protease [bacterium]
MLPPVLGIIPLLIEIFAGFLAGTVGMSLISSPTLRAVAQKAQPSIGIVLADRPSGTVSGTAFVVDRGMAVTSYHVVVGSSQLRVKFPKSAWVEPTIVASDASSDLAILAISDPSVPPLPLGDAASVRAGDDILAFSFPSVADLTKQSQDKDKQARAALVTEATIKALRNGVLVFQPKQRLGDDGGPIMNLKGQVVGTVRGQLPASDAATSFAVPADAVKLLLADALKRQAAALTPSQQPPPAAPGQAQPSPPTSPSTLSVAQPVKEVAAPPQPQAPPPVRPQPPLPPHVPPAVPLFSVVAESPPPPPPAPTQPQEPVSAPSQAQGSAPAQPPHAPPTAPARPRTPPTAPARTPPAAPPRSTTVTPSRPAAPSADHFAVVPGTRVGPVKLGMPVQDVRATLGAPSSTDSQNDGTTLVRWYKPPRNDGIGVQVTKGGTVDRIWAINDGRFTTVKNVHIGSTEAEVRAALGAPSNVAVDDAGKTKTLYYRALGLWFYIQLDRGLLFYNQVYEIGVLGR